MNWSWDDDNGRCRVEVSLLDLVVIAAVTVGLLYWYPMLAAAIGLSLFMAAAPFLLSWCWYWSDDE
jgi:hypothetical protein